MRCKEWYIMGYIDFFHFCFWGTHDAASSIKLLRFNLLPIFTLYSILSCKAIETSISMDDFLNNSFELSINTKNLLFSR